MPFAFGRGNLCVCPKEGGGGFIGGHIFSLSYIIIIIVQKGAKKERKKAKNSDTRPFRCSDCFFEAKRENDEQNTKTQKYERKTEKITLFTKYLQFA